MANDNDTTTLPACRIDRMTFAQARGRIISACLQNHSRDSLADKLTELYPDARVSNDTSARSLASQLAWRLLPGRGR